MFNAFNGQPGNYAAWQMGFGNLQGNYSAPHVPNSFPEPNGFPGPQGPYMQYGAYPQQLAWQSSNPVLGYHHQDPQQAMAQQHYHYQQFYSVPALHLEPQPPLPDGAPPPLPPTPTEDPPPLPPDGPPRLAPLAPAPENHVQQQNQVAERPATAIQAGSDAWGPYAHFSQPKLSGGGAGASQGPPHSGSWPNQHGHPQQAQQAPYHHMGHAAAPSPYPSFQQTQPSQPPDGYAQPPPHAPVMPPPGPTVPTAAAYTVQLPQAADPAAAPAAAASAPVAAASPPAPVIVDITRLLRPPHRATRPRKLLLVLRGLPGSGKSTLARKIREAEAEAGADVPRLHSLDDYYMQEVEVEVVEEEGGRRKRRKVTELKYVYEPDMEAAYFRDLVRAVGRSCEDRRHSFVVVDAPVLRGEQLRELMAVGQRANFECFALLPLEMDPAVCAAPGRNAHGHSEEALREMAAAFEAAPPLYAQVSAVSLFGGPVVGEETAGGGGAAGARSRSSGPEIQEVEMDEDDSDDDGPDGAAAEDGDGDCGSGGGSQRRRPASRWDDHEDDGGGGGGGGGGAGAAGERRQRRKKREKTAKLRSVADIDEKGILLGLNDALAAAAGPDGGGAAASAAPAAHVGKRAPRPVRSALRRRERSSPSLTSAAGPSSSGQRRVWWPDQAQGSVADSAAEAESSTSGMASNMLVEVVYLEGLGPPPELDDLPYGHQRRSPAAPARGGGDGDGSGAVPQRAPQQVTGPHPHGSFRDQAKAEHEAEHDLFRRLLLGKQGASGGGPGRQPAAGGGAPQLGLFAAPLDGDEDDADAA